MSFVRIGPALLFLVTLFGSASVHADRDIVYAARYYTPPGSHRTSHFHLYRINPDGTGKTQLTFGNTEDHGATWSPDGTALAFTRQSEDGRSSLCLLLAAGGSVQTLLPSGPAGTEETYDHRWSPDSRTLAAVHWVYGKSTNSSVSLLNVRSKQVVRRFVGASDFLWSPDSRRAYLAADTGDKLLDLASDREVPVQDQVEYPVWQDAQTLIGVSGDTDTGYFLRSVGADGQEKSRMTPTFPASMPELDGDTPRDRSAALFGSRPQQTLVYALNNHDSTVGVDWLFLGLDKATGHLHYLTEGRFLAWSPDGSRFCTAPGRDTTPYEKRQYPFEVERGASADERVAADYRLVWFAPLSIRATRGGPMKQLTPRLCWVMEADWRKTPKPISPKPMSRRK